MDTEVRDRLQRALDLNPDRPRVTVRRPDLRQALSSEDALLAQEAETFAPSLIIMPWWQAVAAFCAVALACTGAGWMLHG